MHTYFILTFSTILLICVIVINNLFQELDLNDSSTFRDFTKPMGAQTPDRLNQFKKRFKEWDDPHGSKLFNLLVLFIAIT